MVHGTRKSHTYYKHLVRRSRFLFQIKKNGFFAQLLLEWLIAFRGWTSDQPHPIATYPSLSTLSAWPTQSEVGPEANAAAG